MFVAFTVATMVNTEQAFAELEFQSISKLITSPNRKDLLQECKRGEGAHR